jgi:hypothetical protein
MRFFGAATIAVTVLTGLSLAAPAAETAPLISVIKSVKREGAGNAEAAEAWRKLVALGPAGLAETLAAMDGADPVADNWLRLAVEAVADAEMTAGRPLPKDALEAFVKDSARPPGARRLAYEWLARADPTAPDRLIPGMLEDPGPEMRRDAVARVVAEGDAAAKKGDRPAAAAAYGRALFHARDARQVVALAGKLKDLGVVVDVGGQLGFLREWKLAGPFEGKSLTGYAAAHPPEAGVDPAAEYSGKDGLKFKWVDHATADPQAAVDLNIALGKHKGAVAYAWAAVDSPAERPVELRVGSTNAVKVFLNGQLVAEHEEYHHGQSIDQYGGKAVLKKGRNEILVKIVQNEQSEVWAQGWSFQLRVCDSLGTAVRLSPWVEKKEKKQ